VRHVSEKERRNAVVKEVMKWGKSGVGQVKSGRGGRCQPTPRIVIEYEYPSCGSMELR
jgi:hypothetical protein